MIDKLEVGQKIKQIGGDEIYIVDYVGRCSIIMSCKYSEISCNINTALSGYELVKPEPKEIKVKWYRDNGSIFCTDTEHHKSKHWEEIECIDGRFYGLEN